jgi:CheY-like chemotaxis protein
VLRASDGPQGLEMLRRRKPDAMVLDLVMPGTDGWALLEEKAADPDIRDIPVIVVSAQDPTGIPKVEDAVQLSRIGGFTPRELIRLVSLVGDSPSA